MKVEQVEFSTLSRCMHCDQEYFGSNINSDNKFCCSGCQAVYELLKSDQFQLINPVQKRAQNFDYLDHSESLERFTMNDGKTKMRFFVEGVQCATCLWLLENIPQWLGFVKSSRLVMGQDTLTVELYEPGRFSEVANFLWAIGYKVRAIEKMSEAEEFFRAQQKIQLKRMAVAVFCTGNIMLFSIPVYSDMPWKYEVVFHWISFVIFLPVLFYSSIPFYQSALRVLRLKSVNIDIPIVFALLVGSALSIYNLISQNGHVYFDSLSALIALLLVSRTILRSIQKNYLSNKFLQSFIENQPVEVIGGNDELIQKWPNDLKEGDRFVLRPGQIVPVESEVLSDECVLNPALISGESTFIKRIKHDSCDSGMKVERSKVSLKSLCDFSSSKIYLFLNEIEENFNNRSEFSKKIDQWAKVFVGLIVVVSFVFLGVYSFVDIDEAIHRVLAFSIMACPCALAFAIPLLESLSLKRSASKGVLVKNPDVFEKLKNIKNVLLDKTGTLTHGSIKVKGWRGNQVSPVDLSVLYTIERSELHPIARAFCDKYSDSEILKVDDIQSVPGVGVSGLFGKVLYEFKAVAGAASCAISAGFYKDGELIDILEFSEELRNGAAEAVEYLKSRGLHLALLSGDKSHKVNLLGDEFGLENYSGLSPQDKIIKAQSFKNKIYVGDGFNDLGAMAASDVSVTVQGGLEACLKVSDVYLTDDSLSGIIHLFEISEKFYLGLKVLLRLSFIYNFVFGILSLMGYVSPLVAAIAMPLSSLMVIILAFSFVYFDEIKKWIESIFLFKI